MVSSTILFTVNQNTNNLFNNAGNNGVYWFLPLPRSSPLILPPVSSLLDHSRKNGSSALASCCARSPPILQNLPSPP